MLAESIIRIGRPIKNSNDRDMPCREKIRLLTDVSSENCKNFFRHVFLIETNEKETGFVFKELGDKKGKDDFNVNVINNVAFPIFYPNGGNPLNAQGIYPLPCYLLYDPHIKALVDRETFKKDFLLPRLKNTLGYMKWSAAERTALADRIAGFLAPKACDYVSEEKQLGIIMIFDERLAVFQKNKEKIEDPYTILIGESPLTPGWNLYLDGRKVLEKIIEAKFYEAAELGQEKDAISTFSNRRTDRVVSIYNKSWLWLSPTWEAPRSIYWGDDEWTKGIKVDEESYAAYLYGVQFLKNIQVPISSAVVKEMFAPITNVKAKKMMSVDSFESIYGIPLVLPLADGDSQQLFSKYRSMLKKENECESDSDLHLKVLAGIDKVVPEMEDKYRLTILYYSGDLSRGNMHIRAVIEDVIPSVAGKVEKIINGLKRKETDRIQEAFNVNKQPFYRTQSLPSLLANAYGPGYVWDSLRAVFYKEPLRLERLRMATARKLNELANREDIYQMKQELIFYYSFIYFHKQYNKIILQKQEGVNTLADWDELKSLYGQGKLELGYLKSTEHLGFTAGLLLRQFSNSYYQKTGKDFVKNRVMKFGSKLTPEMVWKNGLMRCEELAQQWAMNLGANFRPVLAQTLLGFIEKEDELIPEKDVFMTAFWSGYLLYKSDKKNEGDNIASKINEENGGKDHE